MDEDQPQSHESDRRTADALDRASIPRLGLSLTTLLARPLQAGA